MADPIRTMSSRPASRTALLAAGRARENEIRKLWARWGVMPYTDVTKPQDNRPSA